jgi:hypothetical protein
MPYSLRRDPLDRKMNGSHGHPKIEPIIDARLESPLISRNAIYYCAQDFNVFDLARVDRMQVFG